MPQLFDVLFIADPRFPGGTSSALAAEIQAAADMGLRAGLLAIKSPALRRSWPFHREISAHLAAGRVVLLDPGAPTEAKFCLIHHPAMFIQLPARRLDIKAEHLVMILHQPVHDSAGAVNYDLLLVRQHVAIALGRPPILAPVGPAVRAQLGTYGLAEAEIFPKDWHGLIDTRAWPYREEAPKSAPYHIGRHSRPDPEKWPEKLETALLAWPDRPDTYVTMLGGGPFLRELYGTIPLHWRLESFGAQEPRDFLRGLDFYVYFHASSWIEAFGQAVLEAMATGVVCILPHSFKATFGAGALYGAPEDVAGIITELTEQPDLYAAQSRSARALAESEFGLHRFGKRLAQLGHIPVEPIVAAPDQVQRTVLFVTSNGVGLGHLTRSMAIAAALGVRVGSVFLTLSPAVNLVRAAGYHAEYIPFHRLSGADVDSWNVAFAEEVANAVSFHQPDVLVFDGNNPYDGLIAAMGQFPNLKTIWVRRAFWSESHGPLLDAADHFDAVLEPGDIADVMDYGPTRPLRPTVFVTPPIVRLPEGGLLDRAAARHQLELPPNALIAGLLLGSGTNFELDQVKKAAIAEMLASGVTPVEIRSPLARDDGAAATGHHVVHAFPMLTLLPAFDFVISACGYNSFHELMLTGTPAIFVPNEAEEMDLQLRRARYADLIGASLLVRRVDLHTLPGAIASMVDASRRQQMRDQSLRAWTQNGATVAAAFVRDYAYLIKTQQ